MTARALFAPALALLLLLSGCATQPLLPSGTWAERQTHLEQLDDWRLTGKLGVRIPGENGSATLRWRQTPNDYTLDLSGPFGSGRLLIEGQPGAVTLYQGNEPPLTASTAEELIFLSTQWTIPVTHLTWWVRALPAPRLKITQGETNAQGHLTTLEQAGWRLQYSQYQPVASANGNLLMPGKILAEYGDIRLTLIIREWHLGATD